MEMYNGSLLDSLLMVIKDVSSSKDYNIHLINQGIDLVGRTDGIIAPSILDDKRKMNYCNVQLKTVVKYKYENIDVINTTSKADELTAQSMAELLASIPLSKCPTMQFTTDLDQYYHIMFLTQKEGQGIIFRDYKLSGTEAITAISMWLLYFCPHMQKGVKLKPKTTDIELLADVQRAYQNTKEMMKSAPQMIEQDPVFASVEDYPLCLETEDNQFKCQRWVDQFT